MLGTRQFKVKVIDGGERCVTYNGKQQTVTIKN
jgi:hypothetical protein